MIRLFFTSLQKYGRWIASEKLISVGWRGNHSGVSVRMSLPGLNAVLTIQ
jgi:hypothetical protein